MSIAFDKCQRWKNRRASYRPAGEVFDGRYASIQPIDEATAKSYVEREHYSASYPAARMRAGLLIKEPFKKEELVGVGVFSVPMNQRVIPAYFKGFEPNQGAELGRFVLSEHVAANGESWALSRMLRLLRNELPEVKGVVAYCDPLERRDENGELVKRGHCGTIYTATNSAYRGRSSPRTLWIAPNGMCVADRMLSKIRLGETGAGYALAKLRALGAPARLLGEGGIEYVLRLKTEAWLRPLQHPGNLVFSWTESRRGGWAG